jgi:hypothetical protein
MYKNKFVCFITNILLAVYRFLVIPLTYVAIYQARLVLRGAIQVLASMNDGRDVWKLLEGLLALFPVSVFF